MKITEAERAGASKEIDLLPIEGKKFDDATIQVTLEVGGKSRRAVEVSGYFPEPEQVSKLIRDCTRKILPLLQF